MERFWKYSFWTLEIALLAIWYLTLIVKPNMQQICFALLLLILLVVLYFAEGIELAYTDLRDKDPEQVEPRIRKLLEEIQNRELFFYAQRQVFVVVIISLMTLITNYEAIYLPGVGYTSRFHAPFWFSLVFTSLTVLWFCQVAPKQLAVRNSEQFLAQSAFLWPIIKGLGWINFPAPSSTIVNFFSRQGPFSTKRTLSPSRFAHYLLSLGRYGYSVDRFREEVVIRRGGACTIRRRFLIWVSHGQLPRISGFLRLDCAIKNPKNTLLKIYFAPQPGEPLDTLRATIPLFDALFEQTGVALPGIEEIKDLQPVVRFAEVETEILNWTIENRVTIPEGLWSEKEEEKENDRRAVIILFEFEAEGAENGFRLENEASDSWYQTFASPSRKWELIIRFEEALAVRFARPTGTVTFAGNVHRNETDRFDRGLSEEMFRSGRLQREVLFPLPGWIYKVSWACWSGASAETR